MPAVTNAMWLACQTSTKTRRVSALIEAIYPEIYLLTTSRVLAADYQKTVKELVASCDACVRSGYSFGNFWSAIVAVVMARHGSFFRRFTASFMWNSSPPLRVFNSFQSIGRAIGAPLRARVE
jgi:hypothetical protein